MDTELKKFVSNKKMFLFVMLHFNETLSQRAFYAWEYFLEKDFILNIYEQGTKRLKVKEE